MSGWPAPDWPGSPSPASSRVTGTVSGVGAVPLYDQLVAVTGEQELSRDARPRLDRLDPARELEQAAARGIRFVIPSDDEWPHQLDDLAHSPPVQTMGGPPLGLWVRGPLRLNEIGGAVSVVGSRAATTYGETVAREIGAGLARAGRCVVSGAAFGIDQAAHRGALALDGASVAVLACGVDRAYPAAHRDLLEHLAAVGAVVSELPPGCAPLRMRFLARNRIIAALTRGTVLVEAAIRSGALNTASWATSLSRPLMGVPGPVTSAQSQGVHLRVTEGAAVLVTGPGDVLEVVGDAGQHLQEPPRAAEHPRDAHATAGCWRRYHSARSPDSVPSRRPPGSSCSPPTPRWATWPSTDSCCAPTRAGDSARGPRLTCPIRESPPPTIGSWAERSRRTRAPA